MFTLSYTPDAFRESLNFIPVSSDRLETRPGAMQLLDGNINRAIGWNNAVVFQRYGQLTIWHVLENKFENVEPSTQLNGTVYQALTGYGDRQERMYIASGKDVFYIWRKPTEEGVTQFYDAVYFDNEIKDEQEQPFALPRARQVVTWRSRLWASDGSHIIYHTENDKPHSWDPINAMQFQSGKLSDVTALCPHGNQLIVATSGSLWTVTGTSKYNWQLQQIVTGHGAVSAQALASDGSRLFYLDRYGLFELGNPRPLSEPIENIFYTPDSGAEILLDPGGELLYLLIDKRLFVYNTTVNDWGEIDARPKGLVIVGNRAGWYGVDGLWLMTTRYAPDTDLKGNRTKISGRLRTWPSQPNPFGMASLNRVFMSLEGMENNNISFSVYADENSPAGISDQYPTWRTEPRKLQVGPDTLTYEKSERVAVEAPVNISDYQFEQEIRTEGYLKIHTVKPDYYFTERT